MGDALGPVLGGLLGVGGGIANAAATGGGPQFSARDAQVNPNAYKWGGSTAEEGAAGQASDFYNWMNAMNQTAQLGRDFGNRNSGMDSVWGGTGGFNAANPFDQSQLNQARGAAEKAAQKAREAGSMAEREAKRNEGRGDAAQGRIGAQLNTTNIDAARALNEQARGRVMGGLDLYQSAAEGKQPSAAEGLLQQGLDRNIATQRSLAAGAKAPGMQRAELLSQGLQNAGNLGAQTQQQAAVLRAQEMEAARQGYLQGGLGLRQGDAQLQGLGLEQSVAQGRLDEASKARNDAMQQFYESQRQGVMGQQFAANQRMAEANQTGIMHADDVNSRVAAAQAEARRNAVGGIMGGAMGGIDMGAKIAGIGGYGNNPTNPVQASQQSQATQTPSNGGGGKYPGNIGNV